MKFILGKKIEMTQVFNPDGAVIPVTKVKVGPCLVMQKKNIEKDGYIAVKCAFKEKKQFNKPMLGMFKKFSKNNYQYLREFVLKQDDVMNEKLNEGDVITADIFEAGDIISIVGNAKGKGFQGVVKRHGFRGGKKSHGHKDQLRMPGSIGSTGPARVFKGMRMGGRTGGQQVTVTGLEVVNVDVENGILYIKGAIPGARNGLLKIFGQGEFEIKKQEKKVEEKSVESSKDASKVEKNDTEKVSDSTKVEKAESKVENEKKDVDIKKEKIDNKESVDAKPKAEADKNEK